MDSLKMRADVDEHLLTRILELLRHREKTTTADANAIATLLYAAGMVCDELEDRTLVVEPSEFLRLAEESFRAVAKRRRP
jgi:hypothetical protein